MRTRRHGPRARGAAIPNRRWPTRPRTTVRGTPHDGAARLPLQLPAPLRRTDKPLAARTDRRTDPRLHRTADDLRPATPAPQRVHPADPPHPPLPAHPRGTPTGRVLHQDLHADP